MKAQEIKVGRHYRSKIGGQLTVIRVVRTTPIGNWECLNLYTKKMLLIASPIRFKDEVALDVETGQWRPVGSRCKKCAHCVQLFSVKESIEKKHQIMQKKYSDEVKEAYNLLVESLPCLTPVRADKEGRAVYGT